MHVLEIEKRKGVSEGRERMSKGMRVCARNYKAIRMGGGPRWTSRQGSGYAKKFGPNLIVIRSHWGAFDWGRNWTVFAFVKDHSGCFER